MSKHSITSLALFAALSASSVTKAQYAADALRYSEINQTGTARFQALGGNHASIGGDASSIFGNPAGLGFYSRSEIAFSPAVTALNSSTRYITGSGTDSKANFNVAHASMVFTSQPGFQRKWKRSSLGISFSRQQSFQGIYNFSSRNDKSAYLDKVIEDANNQKLTVSQLETDFESNVSNGGPIAYSLPAAYYQMYLINPTSASGPPYNPLDRNSAVDQFGSYDATGANTQWNVAYAGNYNDKLYIGGSVGFSRIRYEYDRLFEDRYVSSPELIAVQQGENLKVTGNGINLAFGLIYKINPLVQLGGSLTSPTFTAIRETFNQNVSAQYVDNLVTGSEGTLITPDYTNLAVAPNDFEYRLASPWRGSVGATFFVNDNGFITGTVDYVGYGGMRVRTNFLNSADNADFKANTNAEIGDTYKSVANFRLGGEYRVNRLRARLGIAYLSDPYRSGIDDIDRSKMLFSAGLGVRTGRFFADLTGTYTSYKSAFTPYTLSDVEEYSSAEITTKPVNVVLTAGFFF
ncbi:hypothetical protein HWI92_01110 [Dyadobacter sandarakinus]|uniref:Outer membrane protein transport protein (OMPP1/FadL/TodX) n=1 Tax=Dyadobacter sandarakinus TaxID=2747268 RepID=A0ABX7IDD5_9BACT|nr:hypothetical protein HWI92_01110 [Dyadobacter sandarakinus]